MLCTTTLIVANDTSSIVLRYEMVVVIRFHGCSNMNMREVNIGG
jgi:hypothetical protein